MHLVVGISILLTSDDGRRNHYLTFAQELLKHFVEQCPQYYGETFVVYNVHGLIHLAEDVEVSRSSLNSISAFKFENHLQSIKKLVKSAHNPVVQVTKRLGEIESTNTHPYRRLQKTHMSSKLKDCDFLFRNAKTNEKSYWRRLIYSKTLCVSLTMKASLCFQYYIV